MEKGFVLTAQCQRVRYLYLSNFSSFLIHLSRFFFLSGFVFVITSFSLRDFLCRNVTTNDHF